MDEIFIFLPARALHIETYAHTNTHTQKRTHTHAHKYIHTYTHTHTHTHTNRHTSAKLVQRNRALDLHTDGVEGLFVDAFDCMQAL